MTRIWLIPVRNVSSSLCSRTCRYTATANKANTAGPIRTDMVDFAM